MTFTIHKMWMFNFRSYAGNHEFEFPTQPGLYFLSGKNKVDDLGSNGSGKSTFLEAITWCLYGRTTRGLKANDIITWGLSTACVELELTVGDRQFRVKRSQKPNILLLIEDGVDKPVDQEELEKHLRLNFKAFISSVLNAQFGVSFFQLSPTEKLDLFSKINDLDYWLEKSEEASTAAKKLDTEINEMSNLLATEQGWVAAAKADMSSLRERAAAFEEESAKRGAALYMEMKGKAKEIDKLNDKLDGLRKKRNVLMAGMKERADKEKDEESVRDSILDFMQELSRNRSDILATKKEREARLAECKSLKGECPICTQSINSVYINRHVTRVEEGIKELEVRAANVAERIRKKTLSLVKAKTALQLATLEATDWRNALNNNSLAMTKVTGAIAEAERNYERLQKDFKKSKEEENPYVALLKAKKAKLEESKQTCLRIEEAKAKLEAEHAAVSYWPKGFKRIRLFIIEQAFQTLEVEVNNSLAALGMPDWQIGFAIEKENKSGGVTKGFTVLINSPRNTEPVKWESWSGGESQRLQLAGDLGLSNLIMQQAGLQGGIEFYDEFSVHMSKEGILDTLNMLRERAETDNKVIYVIDHHSHEYAGFVGGFCVVKTNKGTVIDGSR